MMDITTPIKHRIANPMHTGALLSKAQQVGLAVVLDCVSPEIRVQWRRRPERTAVPDSSIPSGARSAMLQRQLCEKAFSVARRKTV